MLCLHQVRDGVSRTSTAVTPAGLMDWMEGQGRGALVQRRGWMAVPSLGWESEGTQVWGAGGSPWSRVWLGLSEVRDLPIEMSSG